MNNTSLTIGIDLGNYQIKTVNFIFPAGLICYGEFDPNEDEAIKYEDQFYVLALNHDSIELDKTKNDRYYVLMLFAVIKECIRRCPDETHFNVNLAIGVMPTAMNRQYNLAIREYYMKNQSVSLTYNNSAYEITFSDFQIFPTGLAAIAASNTVIQEKPRFVLIDIGGGTTEYLVYRNRQIDRSKCFSVNEGTISVSNEAIMQVSSQYGYDIDETEINMVLHDLPSLLPDEVQFLIKSIYHRKALSFIHRMRDYGIDPQIWHVFLTGGGCAYFLPYFTVTNGVCELSYESDIQANAVGIELLAIAEQHKKSISYSNENNLTNQIKEQ